MSVLSDKKVLIGISGGIAAYKIPILVRLLIKLKSSVRIVMTPNSKNFVSPLTLSTLSRNEVLSSFTKEEKDNPIHYLLSGSIPPNPSELLLNDNNFLFNL